MRYLLLCLAFACSLSTQAQQAAEKPKEFAIILHLNPAYQEDSAWKADDMQAVGDHFAALQKLQAEGKLSFAGRTTNKASLGLIVLKNMTEEEARAILAADKAVQRGIMTAELQAFQTVLKEK